jgi:hypothetical protein
MCRIGSIEVGEVAKPYTSLSASAPVRVALRAIGNFLVRGRQTALMFFVEARAIGEPINEGGTFVSRFIPMGRKISTVTTPRLPA